jgi:Flp pilus assembly protein TadB
MKARSRRLIRIFGGFALLAVGVPLLFLPGPGFLTIVLGLAMLAAEYVWAAKLLASVKRQSQKIRSGLPYMHKNP